MKFAKLVRNSKVAGPFRNDFNKFLWIKSYDGNKEDDFDSSLFHAGLDILKLKNALLNLLPPGPFSLRTKKRIVGIINREIMVVVRRAKMMADTLVRNNTIRSDEVAQILIDLPGGGRYSPDEIIQTANDAYAVISRYINECGEHGVVSNDISLIRNLIELAGYYVFIQNIWDRCLWGEYKYNGQEYVPYDEHWYASLCISDFRRSLLIQQMTTMFQFVWENHISPADRAQLVAVKFVKNIFRRKRRTTFSLIEFDSLSLEPPASLVYRIQAEELYYKEMLDMVLPSVPGISLRELLNVWEVLRSLAAVIFGELPSPRDVANGAMLEEYAQSFRKMDILWLFQHGARVSSVAAEEIIDFLEYRDGADPYLHPLIKDSKGQYSILLAPILFGNMLRTLEQWMKESGIKIDEKGNSFERHVRDSIVRVQPSGWDIFVAPDSVEIVDHSDDRKKEQIDLLIVMNNRVYVGEIKCYLFPQSPLERYRFKDKLCMAALQVKRKCEFARKNIGRVYDLFTEMASENNDIHIYPLIIVNTAVGCGFNVDGVPVVDLMVLERYFSEGNIKTSVVSREHIDTIDAVKFYTTKEDAYDKFWLYLNDPPQLNIFKEHISKHKLPIINYETGEQEIFEEWRVHLPDTFSIHKH